MTEKLLICSTIADDAARFAVQIVVMKNCLFLGLALLILRESAKTASLLLDLRILSSKIISIFC